MKTEDDDTAQGEGLFALPCFYSVGVINGWRMPTRMGEGRSPLSLLNRMLISSRNTLTNPSRNDVLPALCASLNSVKLTHIITHHRSELDILKQERYLDSQIRGIHHREKLLTVMKHRKSF